MSCCVAYRVHLSRCKAGGRAPAHFTFGPSDILCDAAVEIGPAIAEEAESGAMPPRLLEVELGGEHPGFGRAELRQHVAALVADEAVAVETLAVLAADPVRGHDRNHVGDGV